MHCTSCRLRQIRSPAALLLCELLDLRALLHELCPDPPSQLGREIIELIVWPAHGFRALDMSSLPVRSLPGLEWVGGRFRVAVW